MPGLSRTPTCRELVELLADYLSGDLAPEERTSLERHLLECAECLAYLRSYRATVRTARAVYHDLEGELPPDVPEALVQAILAARGQ